MIIAHAYEITFRNEKTLKASYALGQGITVISGSNGAGKSTFLETITANLFGTIAFRQKAEDYKSLSMQTVFKVREKTYTVSRKGNVATLTSSAGETLASGTKAVNAEIRTLFGYNFDVFRVSNYIEQGDIEAFIRMRPAERKKLVDQSIGLNQIDALIAASADRSKGFAKEAMILSSTLKPVEAPVKPEAYAPSSDLSALLSGLRKEEDERQQLLGWMLSAPSSPEEEPLPLIDQTSEELVRYQQDRKDIQLKAHMLDAKINLIPMWKMTAQEIQKWRDAWSLYYVSLEKRKAVSGITPPRFTSEELDAFTKQWEAYHAWTKFQELMNDGNHTCPMCDHAWPKNQAELTSLGEVVETSPPELSMAQIRKEAAVVEVWDSTAAIRLRYADIADNVPAPPVTEATLRDQEAAQARAEERLALQQELAGIVIPDDRAQLLTLRREFDQKHRDWEASVARYVKWTAERDVKAERLAELKGVPAMLAEVEPALQQSRDYERDRDLYTRAKAAFDETAERVQVASDEAADWGRAKTALQSLKVKVKSHLLPSLRRAASSLLSTMSEGRFSSVEISDEMEVVVDGQGLHTLSGSERTLVSLSLRLGLGLVLTSRVFPCILGDEIDASCTDERAEAILEGLSSLKHLVGQMVIVSHRNVSGDAQINMQ